MKKNMSKMKLFSDFVLMWTYTLATYHFGKVASLKLQNKRRYLERILLELLCKPDRSTKRIHPNCAAQPLLAIVGICFEYRLAEDSQIHALIGKQGYGQALWYLPGMRYGWVLGLSLLGHTQSSLY